MNATSGRAMARRLTTSSRRQIFRARRFEEFEARGRREEQLAHLDPRARLAVGEKADGRRAMRRAAIDTDLMRLARLGAAGDGEPRDGADGRQRLAAKAHRGDVGEIVFPIGARQLRGRVAFDREASSSASMPSPSSSTRIRSAPPLDIATIDAPGAGIERVLDQLLGCAGRALDHLARGDAVDRAFGKTADFG